MYHIIRDKNRAADVMKLNQKTIERDSKEVSIDYLTFPSLSNIPEIEHLFSTRMGGVSEGDFASMNLSFSRGDKQEAVFENFTRIAQVMNCEPEDFVLSRQTHTTNIRILDEKDKGKGVVRPMDYDNVDGLITKEKGICLSTFFADCVPLYFVDPVNHVIGLAHSGWKGTLAEMGRHMVETMQNEFGCDPAKLHAAIGPSICRECYEVSEEVALPFMEKYGKEICTPKAEEGKYLLDLWLANRMILEQAGIPRENIEVTDVCTCHNPNLLFSHRYSQGRRGNLGAFLMLRKNS